MQKSEDNFNRLESEEIELHNVLECNSSMDIHMAGIYINNKLESFFVGNYNRDKQMAVIHMEKANIQFHGLYPFINQQFLS